VNASDKRHHETEVCDFRKLICHDCGQLKNEVKEMKDQIKNEMKGMKEGMKNEIKNEMKGMKGEIKNEMEIMKEGMKNEIKDEMKGMKEGMKEMIDQVLVHQDQMQDKISKVKEEVKNQMKNEMKGMIENEMKGMKEEMKNEMKEIVMNAVRDAMAGIKGLEVEMKNSNQRSQATCSSDARENIFLVGGYHDEGWEEVNNKSTECFTWADQTWTVLDSAVFEGRYGTCSFLHQGQMVVTGGYDNDGNKINTMKCLNIADPAATWKDFVINLPVKCSSHKVVNHNDRLFMSGGNVKLSARRLSKLSDAVYEVQLVPPYASKILTRLPQPRCQHGMEMFDQKLFILGGDDGKVIASVVQYDLIKNECKEMPPLPYAVLGMATVLWRNNVLVIGGRDHRYQCLNKVAMYDVITGRSQMLPCMKNRSGCTAVLTGNVVVVMGGRNENGEDLKSVECFDLERQVWQDLPDMLEPRVSATAVVKPNH
jgi:N-acetylneuraminic acid mutarotase/F0F1-type ATP synthase membrane subunit b/b'